MTRDQILDYLVDHKLTERLDAGDPPNQLRRWKAAVRADLLESERLHPGFLDRAYAGLQRRLNPDAKTGTDAPRLTDIELAEARMTAYLARRAELALADVDLLVDPGEAREEAIAYAVDSVGHDRLVADRDGLEHALRRRIEEQAA